MFQHLNVTTINDEGELRKLIFTIKQVVSPEIPPHVIENAFRLNYPELRSKIDEGVNNVQKNAKSAPNTFANMEGRWRLAYTKIGGLTGSETLKLDKQGNYFLEKDNGDKHYFSLRLLSEDKSNCRWQKIQVIDGKITPMVHSNESLHFENQDKLVGKDTLGYDLIYTRISI